MTPLPPQKETSFFNEDRQWLAAFLNSIPLIVCILNLCFFLINWFFHKTIIIIDNNVLVSNTSIIILIFSWKERNKWPWFISNWGIPICMYCSYCIIYYYTYLGHYGCKLNLTILSLLIQNYWKMFKTMQFFKMWQKFHI